MLSEKEAASRSCAAAAATADAAGAAEARAASFSSSSSSSPASAARRFVGRSGIGIGSRTDNGAGRGGITNNVGDCGVLLVRRRTKTAATTTTSSSSSSSPAPSATTPLSSRDRPPAGFGLGERHAAAVDWRATVLLNLALQSSYALAVVACRKGALRDSSSSVPRAIAAASSAAAAAAAAAKDKKGGGGEKGGGGAPPATAAAAAASSETSTSGPLPPLALPLGGHGVRHDVFASPMRLAFELSGGERGGSGSGPEPSYPEICFSVDVGGEAAGGGSGGASSSSSADLSPSSPLSSLSSELELASPGDVFAVFLVATGGPALATGSSTAKEDRKGGEENEQQKDKDKTKKEPFVEIFSGFVSYEQLVDALPCAKIAAGNSSSFRDYGEGGGGGGGAGKRRREHVRMRGPGGKGVADVAVSVLFRAPPPPSASSSSSGGGGGDLVARTVAARDGLLGVGGASEAATPSSSSTSALAATARALLRAAAAAVALPPLQRPAPSAGPPVFGCSLFCLSLPVETLAGRLLGLPDPCSSS